MSNGDVKAVLNGEVLVEGAASQPNGTHPHVVEPTAQHASAGEEKSVKCEVLVVGAGFSGISAIYRLRKEGLDVKCFESGEDFGGVWYWNRYPGARVDSEMPFYQLNIPEVYKTWNFTQRFPDHRELRKYMAHIDKTLDLRKDTYFNARVNDCKWSEQEQVWNVKTQQGHVAQCKYLFLTSGLLHRLYTPDFPGLKDFKGELYHSAAWREDFSAMGKKVAVIGAGATAVQITQELGKEADEMTVFLRRPSYCHPMGQRPLTDLEQSQFKIYLPALFAAGRNSYTGFPSAPSLVGVFDVPEEERLKRLEMFWKQGGFQFSLGGYNDVVRNKDANEYMYQFWAKKVRQRLTDPEKWKIMAPAKKPFYFSTKRSPLEQDYYEVLNQKNVHLHDLNAAPLTKFVENGIVTADGKLHEVDAVALATGFDSATGSLGQMGLKNREGVELAEVWRDGVETYLGLTVPGFPNMWFTYGPQTPSPLANGPTIIESQVETIIDMIKKVKSEGVSSIEAQPGAAAEWKRALNEVAKYTLHQYTDSWWNGGNIPGKKAEVMTYMKGINVYEGECREAMKDWKGFDVTKVQT